MPVLIMILMNQFAKSLHESTLNSLKRLIYLFADLIESKKSSLNTTKICKLFLFLSRQAIYILNYKLNSLIKSAKSFKTKINNYFAY